MDKNNQLNKLEEIVNKKIKNIEKKQKRYETFGCSMFLIGYKQALIDLGYEITGLKIDAMEQRTKETERRLKNAK